MPVALLGIGLSAIWFVLHLTGIGGWHLQVVGYRVFAPLLSAVPAWLAWRAARRAPGPGARRHLRVMAAAWVAMTASSVYSLGELVVHHDLRYPTPYPAVQILDLLTLVLVLAGLLLVPVRTRWAASRLRLGLDMATVLLAGAIFLWYFTVEPNLGANDTFLTVTLFVQSGGVLVVLFAIARLALAGVAEVSRVALGCYAAAGVVNVLLSVMQQAITDPARLHWPLAMWPLFTLLLTAGTLAASSPSARASRTGQKPSSMMPYAAVVATDALLVHALVSALDARAWAVLAGAITLTGLVVTRQIVGVRDNARLVVRLDASLHAQRRAMAREQLLSDLGTTLLRTTDVDRVHELAADGAATVLAECAGVRTAILTVDPEDPRSWIVAYAAGERAGDLIGGRLPDEAIPAALLGRLAAGEVISAPGIADLGLTGPESAANRPVIMLPLVNGDRFFGLLSVAADTEPPQDVVKSLLTLRTQISLALVGLALTAELTTQAMHDGLTGLGNRTMLKDRLTAAIARSQRHGRPVGVLLLDLNGFKPVNDTYGHDAGDALLKVVADRLRTCVRTEDTVARLGGDEFVIVAEDLRAVADALVIADRVVAALNETVLVGEHPLSTPASIGIALSVAGQSPDDVLRNADAAMYVAKRAGGGRYHVHSDGNVRA
ncbi:hypothetical protein GCM10010168_54100 [Actinoplanes ianthinogenes]|uniref:GGDEF domain-containing protein n=1 Tax=Actinoplanes ianthinogenes TaxID=122358 RepID=A0ABM7LQS6_9ACTN|nr:GGDEF domain-containing protein [Actinoplanes ianthinogenes]BCJ41592.1 hypothetical protein Aiant_22490 [Actinoplanes ianthinogenes]GGR29073.1 hypothetical protein GCM10010168_54100 [Actinoplanes ianthinogenes]